MSTIYLVSCVSKKLPYPAPACDLYVSDWFKKARRYVEQFEGSWFILSARYGLVHQDTNIEPYEQTLNKMPINERRVWAENVLQDLKSIVNKNDKVVLLAGERYKEFIITTLSERCASVEEPLKHKKIGQQLKWLKENTRG